MYTATQEQIDAWKKEFGSVFKITVQDCCCYLKKAPRKSIGYASVASNIKGKSNPVKFNEFLLKECWLAGDEEIKTNDDLFLSVSAQLAEIIETSEAELVKL